jgi:FkbM family methyltransferase
MSSFSPIDVSDARWLRRQAFRLLPIMGWVTRTVWQSRQESHSSRYEQTFLWQTIWKLHRRLGYLPRLQKSALLVSLDLGIKMNLNLSRLNDVFVFCYGPGESDVLRAAEMFLRPNSVVLDVGANIGSTTLVFAKLANYGHVYAFEPSLEMCEVLAENVRLSKLHNVSIEPYGLSDSPAKGSLRLDMVGNPGSAYFIPNPTADVSLRVLDEIFGEDFHVDFIKIDVEGYECHVLNGGVHIIDRCKPVLVFEVNQAALSRSGFSSEELLDLVRKLGYRFFYLDQSRLCEYIPPQNHTGLYNVIGVHPNDSDHWQIVERYK